MAQFNFVLTTLGVALLAKVQAGADMIYTRCAVGDGYLPANTDAEDLTALVNLKAYVPIDQIKAEGTYASIRAVVTNKSVTTGFYIREFGIYATDPDAGEILFAVSESGDSADYLPGAGTGNLVQIGYQHDISCGNAANVAITVDNNLVYVTQAEYIANAWRRDNDGSGSGLDADTVDGVHAKELATDFAGPNEPAVKWPLMRWADTGNNILKLRNLANTAWIPIMNLTTGDVLGATSWGMFYSLNPAFCQQEYVTNRLDLDSEATKIIGPTGSTCDIEWSALNAIPSGSKAIKLNANIEFTGDTTIAREATLTIKPTTTSTYVDYALISQVPSIDNTSHTIQKIATGTIDVVLDSQNRFATIIDVTNPGLYLHVRLYLQGYYK